MHFGDSIFIFLLALVLFGPKKLPEIGRTIGKLLAEFRRASNEFKFQIQEELRNMEEDERRKKLADLQASKAVETLVASDPSASSTAPSILPPSSGSPVSTSAPYAMPTAPAESTAGTGTVEPSAAEVVVDPPAPSSTLSATAAESETERERPATMDLTASNGTHPPITAAITEAATEAEPIPSSVSGETIHHG